MANDISTPQGIRHIVWDWNGTLFDDQLLVTHSTNASLGAVGIPALAADRYQDLYRRPLQDFYLAMVGREFSAEEWELVEDAFSRTYADGMHGCALTADALTAVDAWSPGSQSLLSMYDHDRLVPLVDTFGLGPRLVRHRADGSASGHAHGRAGWLSRRLFRRTFPFIRGFLERI